MDPNLSRLAWYRLRTTARRRAGGYLSIVLLVALIGGLALAAIAGARRTQSSYFALLQATHAPQLLGATGVFSPGSSPSGYDPSVLEQLARLPHVTGTESAVGLNILPIGPNDVPTVPAQAGDGIGSIDGLYFRDLRPTVVQGRMPRQSDPYEFMMPKGSQAFGDVHVGQVVRMGVYTNAQTDEPGFGTARIRPYRVVDVKLVGLVVFDSQIVQDDVDAPSGTGMVVFTPALTRMFLHCCVILTETVVTVSDPTVNTSAVQHEILSRIGGIGSTFFTLSENNAKVQRAIKPESIALAVFGGIAGLAALMIAAQLASRQLRLGASQLATLRALGATPAMTALDGALGIAASVVAGSLLAGAVAVALSPVFPLGPIKPYYPYPGVSVDWTVLGFGVLALVTVLAGVTAGLAYRELPHRGAERNRRFGASGERAVSRVAAAAGLPPAAVSGIRFAVDSGTSGETAPMRSAILGSVLALVVVVATVTFSASLRTLVSHPALYGWNWSYELTAGTGSGDMPAHRTAEALDADRYVSAWTGIYFAALGLDGQQVAVLGATPGASVGPPVLSGHALEAPNQIVLGEATLAELHEHLGGTVMLDNGSRKPVPLRIVGTATLPTIGSSGSIHTEMGSGAVLDYQLIPPAARNGFGDPLPGPNAVLVRLRTGFPPSLELDSLHRVAAATSTTANFGVAVVGVQRPAEIVSYRSMGVTPDFLGGTLAAGAVVALALTLVASVRRRRRDLALLKALGFTRRQIAAAVAWQSSLAVLIGTVLGVPLGVALGRFLWDVFAHEIHVVPAPTVPTVSIVLIAVGALVLANVVATLPARAAARTPTALVLRAE
jgi:hypothetical protein